jgi:hypothetical protein
MIKLMFSAVTLALCAFQTVALAGPMVVMPRVYVAPVRVAPVTPTVKVTPPPARVQAPKASQPDTTATSLIPIMTGIAVMNATSSANAATSEEDEPEQSDDESSTDDSVKE